jgi:polyferredoxin
MERLRNAKIAWIMVKKFVKRTPQFKQLKRLLIFLFSSLVLLTVGELLTSPNLMMISSVALVLSTIAISAGLVAMATIQSLSYAVRKSFTFQRGVR